MEENKETKKFSYEELENICHQLSEQNRHLYENIQEMNFSNLFKRLDYMFKVMDNADRFAPEFVESCANEIITALTVPETEDKENTEEEK